METKQQKIDKIRKFCIAANPSILDLVFGCVFETQQFSFQGTTETICATYYGEESYNLMSWRVDHKVDPTKITKIIGREIRLADVLLAIGNNILNRTPENSSVPNLFSMVEKWNLLKDSLSDQPEPTLDFIISLLS